MYVSLQEAEGAADAAAEEVPAAAAVGQGLGAAHQALLMGGGPVGFQPYSKPNLFPFRVSTIWSFPYDALWHDSQTYISIMAKGKQLSCRF